MPIIGLLYEIACEEAGDPQLIDSLTQLCHEHNSQLLAATAVRWKMEFSFRANELAMVSLLYEEAFGRFRAYDTVVFDLRSEHRQGLTTRLMHGVLCYRQRVGQPRILTQEGVSFAVNCQRSGDEVKLTLEMSGDDFAMYGIDGNKLESIQLTHSIMSQEDANRPLVVNLAVASEMAKTFLTQRTSMPMIEIQSPSGKALEAPLPIS